MALKIRDRRIVVDLSQPIEDLEAAISDKDATHMIVKMHPHKLVANVPSLLKKYATAAPKVTTINFSFHDNEDENYDAVKMNGEDGDEYIHDFQGLASLLDAYAKQLRSLSICVDEVLKDAGRKQSFLASLKNLKVLESFSLQQEEYTDEGVKRLFKDGFLSDVIEAVGSVQTLSTVSFDGVTEVVNVKLASCALKKLSARCSKISSQSLIQLLRQQNNQLSSLQLDLFHLEMQSSDMLVQTIASHATLNTLSLRIVRNSEATLLRKICNGIAESTLEVVELEIRGDDNFPDGTLSSALDSMVMCHSLTSLKLRSTWQSLPEDTLRGFEGALRAKAWKLVSLETGGSFASPFTSRIAQALQSNELKVQKLSLKAKGIHGWDALANTSAANTTLRSLSLSGRLPNYSERIIDVTTQLVSNPKLSHVRFIAREKLPSECAEKLGSILARSFSIEEFDVELSVRDMAHCTTICRLNRLGRKYMVENNSAEKGVDLLGKLKSDVDSTFVGYHHNFHKHRQAKDLELLNGIFFHLRENVETFFVDGLVDGLGDRLRELELTNAILKEERQLTLFKRKARESEDRLAVLKEQKKAKLP